MMIPTLAVVLHGYSKGGPEKKEETNIIEREFSTNEVYHLNYTVTTDMNSTNIFIQHPQYK